MQEFQSWVCRASFAMEDGQYLRGTVVLSRGGAWFIPDDGTRPVSIGPEDYDPHTDVTTKEEGDGWLLQDS